MGSNEVEEMDHRSYPLCRRIVFKKIIRISKIMEYNYSLIEKVFTEYILSYSGPNRQLDEYREEKYSIIKNIILYYA